jgi:hypothetical protein
MLDDLKKSPDDSSHRDGVHQDGVHQDGARSTRLPAAMADREIPIVAATHFDGMHRWLDGDASEAAAQQDPESARYVALWRRVGEETARRSSHRLSSDFTSRVMSALPGGAPMRADLALVGGSMTESAAPSLAAAPAARLDAPTRTWWQGSLELNRGTALAAATGLVAVGLLLGAVFRGQ